MSDDFWARRLQEQVLAEWQTEVQQGSAATDAELDQAREIAAMSAAEFDEIRPHDNLTARAACQADSGTLNFLGGW